MKTLIKPTLCIYHANCADGFGAALAVWLRFADSRPEFVPAAYGETPPNCTGHDVLLVDFSYKLPVLEQIIDQAKSVTILDHHKPLKQTFSPYSMPAVFMVNSTWPDPVPPWPGTGAFQMTTARG